MFRNKTPRRRLTASRRESENFEAKEAQLSSESRRTLRPHSPQKCSGRQSPGGLSGPSPRRSGLHRSRLSHVRALSTAGGEFFPPFSLPNRLHRIPHESERCAFPKSAPLKTSALRSRDRQERMRGDGTPINLSLLWSRDQQVRGDGTPINPTAEQGPAGENEGDGRMTAYWKCLHRY